MLVKMVVSLEILFGKMELKWIHIKCGTMIARKEIPDQAVLLSGGR